MVQLWVTFLRENFKKFIDYIEKDAMLLEDGFNNLDEGRKNLKKQYYKSRAAEFKAACEDVDSNKGMKYEIYQKLINRVFREKNAKKISDLFFSKLNDHLGIKTQYELCKSTIDKCTKIINKEEGQVKYDELEYVKKEQNSKDFMKKFIDLQKNKNLNDFYTDTLEKQNKIMKDVFIVSIDYFERDLITAICNSTTNHPQH